MFLPLKHQHNQVYCVKWKSEVFLVVLHIVDAKYEKG